MSAYYNEIDPYCVQWLKNLIAEGLIAPGDVDDRDIREVRASDIEGYTQAHFFAGIAGWSYALRLAGWPDDRPVWTGSCPCQPFSAAGQGKATHDERHLWPEWFRLTRACKPPTIFGEQVEAAIGWGWLDLVQSDLEAEGYTVGAAVLPACSVGAPHIRQRLWFVADSQQRPAERHRHELAGTPEGMQGEARQQRVRPDIGDGESVGELADTSGEGQSGRGIQRPGEGQGAGNGTALKRPERLCATNPWDNLIWLPCTDGKQRPTGLLEVPQSDGREGCERPRLSGNKSGEHKSSRRPSGQWPTQSIIQPLAHGVPARVAKLRAIGNAICPPLCAEFIKANMKRKSRQSSSKRQRNA